MRAVDGGEEGMEMIYTDNSNMKFSKQPLILKGEILHPK